MLPTPFNNLSVIICTSDETDSLRRTVDTILQTNSPDDLCEIILCYPDFITDDCLKIVQQLCKTYAQVPVLAYRQQKKGIGSGLNESIALCRGSHILIIDSDGSRDVEVVAKLIDGVKKEPDRLYKTSRKLLPGSFHGYGTIPFIANAMGQLLLRLLYGNICTDMTDAMQIVPAALYKSIRFEETGFAFFMEMVLKPMRLGCRYRELPVHCYGRKQGQSHNDFRQKLSYLKVAFKVRLTPKEKIRKQGDLS